MPLPPSMKGVGQCAVELVERDLVVAVEAGDLHGHDFGHVRRPALDGDFAVVDEDVAVVGLGDLDDVVGIVPGDREDAAVSEVGGGDGEELARLEGLETVIVGAHRWFPC